MSIIKKAPAIKTREVRLEEPVNELLEDYARFIVSTSLKGIHFRRFAGGPGSRAASSEHTHAPAAAKSKQS